MSEPLTFSRGGFSFRVESDTRLGFSGFCDGELSITASRPDVAVRALLRKHVSGLPAGLLIDLEEARSRLR